MSAKRRRAALAWRCWECGRLLHAADMNRPEKAQPCPNHPKAETIPWSLRYATWAYATIDGLAQHLRKQGVSETGVEMVVLDYADHQDTTLWPELPPAELGLAALRWLRWGRGPLPEQRLPEPPADAPTLFGRKRNDWRPE